jgi:hypothetical protein
METEFELAEVPGFPGYFIRSDGRAFFADGKEKIVSCKKGRSAKLVIRVNYKMYTLGFATLIAEAFIPNPLKYTRIIFKDRNHHHCHKNNIAWVDDETYFFWCCHAENGTPMGRPRIYIDRDVAVKSSTDENLKNYYATLEDQWLEKAWKELDGNLSELRYWREVKSAVYLHFIDRVKRFSISGKPAALMYYYAKAEHIKLKKTISPNIPFRKLLQTDESLRVIAKR